MVSPKALRYNRKDRPDENLGGQNLRRSKQRKGENPPESQLQADALLMMYQTESLQTVAAGCEIDARLQQKTKVNQTARRAKRG